ncbi:MAG: T9SS type A sorting domain-containing protein [Bacteroidales bacterium]|nr:T9SS type A sorting domain-containing protein [Candidatus Latescibacterota bacterium]
MGKLVLIPKGLWFLVIIFVLALIFPALHARDAEEIRHKEIDLPVISTTPESGEPFLLPAAVGVVAEYTFDNGSCGTEGWVSVDKTEQPGPYFHVDDFDGLGGGNYGGLVPLDGLQSMWCGYRNDPLDMEKCGWCPPGYGNNWDQRFESITFSTKGDVTVSFLMYYDSEGDNDFTYLEYLHKDGHWVELASFDGTGDSLVIELIPGGDVDGATKIRFRFVSDGAWSDEDCLWGTDGAVIIDSLTVTDDDGEVDSQDFEFESVGDLTTLDGDWAATTPTPYGDYAFLFDNSTAPDPSSSNSSCVWGFTNGSTSDYLCGDYPLTITVPYENERGQYIYNEIRSPIIPFTKTGSAVYLFFDVYHDLPLNPLVFYTWSVRYRETPGGCWSGWKDRNDVYYGTGKVWVTKHFGIGDLLGEDLSSVAEIQIALGVADYCGHWEGEYGDCSCHSNAPLFDNVRLLRFDPGYITGNVFNDINGNCVYDEGVDFGICNRRIQAESIFGQFIGYTNGQGDYSIEVLEETYTVDQFAFTGDPWTLRSCLPDPPYTIEVDEGLGYPNNDFRLNTVGTPQCDVSVGIISNGFNYGPVPCDDTIFRDPCPGIEHEYLFWVRNNTTSTGWTTPGQILEIALDPTFTINPIGVYSTDPINCPITFTVDPNNYECEVELTGRINPGQSYVVAVRATPATDSPYVTQMTYVDLGECSGNKTYSMSELSNCSCDPNDLTVTPAGCGIFGNIAVDDRLTYKIRFENVGGGVAHDIFIGDNLDIDLDETTFAIIGSSHAITGVQSSGNNLSIYFDSIDLPGIGDPDNNKGFVIFSIDPHPDCTEGTTITNSASIYFDDNPPVVTNTTTNTVAFPFATFACADSCVGAVRYYNFTFTGGEDAYDTYLWEFGPGGIPATSDLKDPLGITFSSEGMKEVTLTVTRDGCEESVTEKLIHSSCASTAVQMASFSALERDSYTVVEWTTMVESNNAGFNLYRSESEEGEKTRLNDELIPAAGNELQGAEYSFRDHGIVVGVDYYYWTEGVSLNGTASISGSVQTERDEFPNAFGLSQNIPNPFNPTTEIRYSLAFGCHVRLDIYNILGQRVATLVDCSQERGYRTARWDGKNTNGASVSSGIYFYKLQAGSFEETKKMILLR